MLLIPLILAGCRGNAKSVSTAASHDVKLSWQPNREAAVNRAGGGYTIYYSTTANAPAASTTEVSVPYVSGAAAPTTATLNLMPGTYYIRISAFSALNGGTLSEASPEITVSVP